MLKNLFPKLANRALEAEMLKNTFSERANPPPGGRSGVNPLGRERQAHSCRKCTFSLGKTRSCETEVSRPQWKGEVGEGFTLKEGETLTRRGKVQGPGGFKRSAHSAGPGYMLYAICYMLRAIC